MGRTLGKYELGAQIACGGMAEIFHATLRGAGGFAKEVCVKLIQPQYSADPEFRRMFENEALIAGRLQNANVVQVLDYDRDGDLCYIAMEYVFGKDLRAVMTRAAERGERLPLALAARVALDAARGLSAAHRLTGPDGAPTPVVHRDVSPHNILVSFAGEVKITDFGIARLRAAASFTREGALKGKVNYMSPEQAAGAALDVRSDVFSLGIVLWEMLAGARLFDADSEVTVLEKVRHSPIPKPSELSRYVPPDLDTLVMQALERDPAGRFSDAGAMADALQKFLYAWTHDLDEESPAVFLLRIYPEEKRPAARPGTEVLVYAEGGPSAPAASQPVAAAPGEPTAARKGKRAGRPAIVLGAAALLVAAAAGAVWFFFGRPFAPAPAPVQTTAPAAEVGRKAEAPPGGPKAAAPATTEVECSPGTPSRACGSSEAAAEPAAAGPQDETEPRAAAKKPAKAVPKAPKTGTLTINARPWAHVYFKGSKLGTTPLSGVALPEGEQKIILKNPEIGVQKEVRVRIVAGEDHKTSENMTPGE
ncbi:MAG: protein kinase [Deltaproteobacteria bacterium]|nr:protein kinase [Deltaproteobacteria bacterium]